MIKNARRKGNVSHAKAYEYLVNEYFVQFNGHSRFGIRNNYSPDRRSCDLYGLFDAVLVRKDGTGVVFLQVTSNRFHSFAPYEAWVKATNIPVLMLCWVDRTGFKEKRFGF